MSSNQTPPLKRALITGASSGIGAATALALLSAGFEVHGAARREERLEALTGVQGHHLDVTSDASVEALATQFETLDVLVANAGGAFDADEVGNANLASWEKAYEVNVLGTVRTIKAFLPALIASGNGHIVIMGSTAGRIAYENGGSYAAAKHALAAVAGTLRLELNGQPVRVSEIAPGMVKTDEFAVTRFGGDKEKAAKVYQGVEKPLTAEDIAEIVKWSVTLPAHVNIDLLVVRPVAQAAQHKVHRKV
ncbi:MAG: SDR family NAD(P)-dependent oxidoreductase [Actinomycetes bacterium]